MTNEVKLTFAGDSRSLDRTFDNVGKGAKDMAGDVDTASRRVENLGDTLGESTGKFRGGKDILDGFSDSMGALGVSIPGPLGNIAAMAGGVADMADGMGTLLAPAMAKARAGMALLNATIAANPIGFAVLAIAALVAGFVIAYKKSETFRAIVDAAMDGVRTAIGWVVDAGGKLVGWFKDAPGKIGAALAGVAKIITAPYRTAFNFIADAWNATVGSLSFTVPDWVKYVGLGSIAGASWSVPDMGHFANGGRFSGGAMIVGERGPELIQADVPGKVMTNRDLRGAMGGGIATVRLVVDGADRDLVNLFKRIVRVEGGGSVQVALGS